AIDDTRTADGGMPTDATPSPTAPRPAARGGDTEPSIGCDAALASRGVPTPCASSPTRPPPPVAGRRSPLFFRDLAQHEIVEHDVRQRPLQSLRLRGQLAQPSCRLILVGGRGTSPAVVALLGDALGLATVGQWHALGPL